MYLFAKDKTYKNLEGERIEITHENIGKWILVSALVKNNSEHADAGFDPSSVSAVGIAIITPDNSMLRYKAEAYGAIYVDDCTLTEASK